jgi:hypothetical protein
MKTKPLSKAQRKKLVKLVNPLREWLERNYRDDRVALLVNKDTLQIVEEIDYLTRAELKGQIPV